MKKNAFLSVVIILICQLVPHATHAQLRTKKIVATTDTLRFDTLSIAPQTLVITINNKILAAQNYILLPAAATIIWLKKPPIADTIILKYRTLNINFDKKYVVQGYEKLPQTEPIIYNNADENSGATNTNNDLLDFDGLNKNGSISRGVNFGNNQDVSLNSGFNIQLSGKLGNDLELNASMTDNNLPFQPDGYTQTIQDFDRVFVQIKHPKHQLILGDYTLQRPNAYFLQMYKNVQGIEIQSVMLQKPEFKITQTVGASAARGKFVRNVFFGKEGNQGPYKLTGEQGEAFVVIMAGSEKIYLDGQLLQRGEQYDYIMDYNTAEITFTPKKIMTGQARLVAEFEYANQAFLRTALLYKLGIEAKKYQINIHSFTETDLENQPLQQDLTVGQRSFLAGVGSNTKNAYFASADTATYNATKVQYNQIDSLNFRFFRLAQNSQNATYKVAFTYIGEGKGDYIQAASTANGRVFRWVAPTITPQNDTIKRGSYQPVQLLVAPNKQQMNTFDVNYQINKNTQMGAEIAITNFDANKLSSINNNENVGYAARLTLKNEGKIAIKNIKINTKTQLNYEFLNQNFRVLQPYREAEFARNWNLKQIYSQKTEHLGAISIGLYDKMNNGVNYQRANFLVGDNYTATKNKITGNYNKNGWALGFFDDNTRFEFDNFSSKFVKQTAFLHKNLRRATVGAGFLQERNQVFVANTDSLTQNSFYFRQVEAFVASPDTAQNKINLKYTVRQDFQVQKSQFVNLQVAHNVVANANFISNPNHQLELTTTYRFVADTNATELAQGYLGQVEYRGKWLKKLVTTTIFYSFGNGQEPVRDFTFLRVAAGVGNFTWRDFNGNAKPELNEYVQAFLGDSANYVKVFLPNNRYVQTFGSRYNHSINIVPSNILTKKTVLNDFCGRFSILSNFGIERKTQNNAVLVYLNPFSLFKDTALVRSNAQVRNTLFFNRNDPTFGAELQLQNTLNKLLTTNGFSERTGKATTLKTRYNINQKISIETTASQYVRAQKSQFFAQNDFDIQGTKLEPALIYMYKNKFRLSGMYNFTDEKNTLNAANDRAKTHKITFDMNYSIGNTTLLRTAISWVQITYVGGQNTAVAYELLQGLQAGANQVLSLNIQHTLPNSIQIGVGYDARKSATAGLVQGAKVQARYVF